MAHIKANLQLIKNRCFASIVESNNYNFVL